MGKIMFMYYYCFLLPYLTVLASSTIKECPDTIAKIKAPCYYEKYCEIVCNGSTVMDVTAIFGALSAKLPANNKTFSKLRIENTALEELPAHAFAGIQFIQVQIVGAKSLQRVNAGAFLDMADTLYAFNIHDTPVTEYISVGNHGSNLFAAIRTMNALYYLALSSTEIQSLPSNTFSGLAKLVHIYFSNNPIQVIHNKAFANIPLLTEITIKSSPIVRVTERAFSAITGNDYLAIELSDATTLTADGALATGAFDAIGRPTYIRLDGDGMKHLDRRVFESFLADNPSNLVSDSEIVCNDSRNKWISDNYPKVWSDLKCA